MELSDRQLAVIAAVGISVLRTPKILKDLDDSSGAQFGGSLPFAGTALALAYGSRVATASSLVCRFSWPLPFLSGPAKCWPWLLPLHYG
jgi:hypothetical protein